MRDRLEVDLVEGHEFVGEEMERPASLSFWWFAASESDEVGILILNSSKSTFADTPRIIFNQTSEHPVTQSS